MLNRRLVLILALGALLVGATVGFAADRFLLGIYPSHHLREEFKLSVGVNAAGTPNRPDRVITDREVLNLPGHFGKLVAVTGDVRTAILWYSDDMGRLRNVVLDNPGEGAYVIQQMQTVDLRTDERR